MENKNNNPYSLGLDKNAANYAALTPLSFIERAASVYPHHTAVIHGDLRRSWSETYQRCCQLASALQQHGIGEGDTVAVMLPNIPEMLELHFAVPMTGAVLNTQNTRLDAETIAFMLDHGEARVVITDREFSDVMHRALRMASVEPLVVDVDDPQFAGGDLIGTLTYEQLLADGDPDFVWQPPADEWQPITLNYTSGTTGNPKGVVYHHRGAHLNAISNIIGQNLPPHAVYLWTLPMFHCNGWCYPWSVTAVAGTHVCLRHLQPETVFELIQACGVTHFCGAPVVLNMLLNAPEESKALVDHTVTVTTGGAAPPAAIIEGMEAIGIQVVHAYGLTESYGPSVFCAHQDEWDALVLEQKAAKMARQGVRAPALEELMVADPVSLEPVPRDSSSMGEVFMRGNNVMKGYLKNPTATEEAFAGGWFHTGDLAVWHADGYIEVKDRSKDVIISGGENISTIEVEDTLYRHPAVLEAAVVAKSHEHWGEVPCAFITLKEGAEVSAEEIIDFTRDNMAHFKCPKQVVFAPLPKTSTGKVQKFALRAMLKDLPSDMLEQDH
ncbi:acyl-CoA synthetase [Pontibacterium granulatum]|uniref:acyl-CoA synthetase n=1 Tax=Pontibacterium granulatum TaxID=2036029 RepID=UPI00249BC6AC|nr:acyl-CoA synthetase [Pontibacterium granulatum]MDI3324243.1 acyl-CoA synthetase [Pontibacterium granulatum]